MPTKTLYSQLPSSASPIMRGIMRTVIDSANSPSDYREIIKVIERAFSECQKITNSPNPPTPTNWLDDVPASHRWMYEEAQS